MPILAKLLTEAEVYDPEYGGGLCNHLPMALVALEQMGATPARLDDYRRTHVSWLEKLPDGERVGIGAWPFRKADRAAFRDLRADFRQRIAREGWEPVLRASLPELAPGLSAAAFHALIRTAMGVVAKHDGEIAAGLAYWAAHWQRLGVVLDAPAESERSADPLALLERLHDDARFAFDPKQAPDLIDDALLTVGGLSGFDEAIHWLDPAASIADVARAAGVLYAATGDFTALHTVTGTQAVAVLLPYVQEPKVMLPWLWQGLAAAYIAIGRPAIPETDIVEARRAAETPAWLDLLGSAVAEEDEHTVKLCYSALFLGRLTGDRLFRWLAAREVGALKDVGLPAWRR
ncbi:questin oxidase family protein [Dongia deserti]|uniref:questin oxidase family protein n=1 Tax=Dongia deserti TaxID=2268030 RepID=UPI000E650731|nr:questin oxidase family protein [Dongia deserti]